MSLDRRFIDGKRHEPARPVERRADILSWPLYNDRGELQKLHAGPLKLLFEDGSIRYVRLGGREIVRRVYCAVRDQNWRTVPDQISELRTRIYRDSFQIQFDVKNSERDIDFEWKGFVIGDQAGRITFEMNGVANKTFFKNRIGFCVLHPMDLAGAPVEIQHDDSSREQTQFPRYIAAENPFQNVVGMRHQVEPGVDVELMFEGDIFETEDQRNWIDASFKTFCTPLSRPRPVEIRAGERVFQRITIALHYDSKEILKPLVERGILQWNPWVTLSFASRPAGPLPKIGFTLPSDCPPISPRQAERLRRLKPSHLRCDVKLAGDIGATLHKAIHSAAILNTSLDLALFIGSEPERELAALVSFIERTRPPIARWTIFPAKGWSTTRDLIEAAIHYLRPLDPKVPIGGGTPANFRELNGQRPPTDVLDFITWSLTPQIHAFDDTSLVETLAAHATTVESARQFAGSRPLVVGPITFKMQTNPYATGPWPPPTPFGQLPHDVDPRQLSLFGAGWTIGSIKYLAESGVEAATYYDLVGWKGLMEHETGSPLPDEFPTRPGWVFPVYHVFADLAEMPDARVLPLKSSDPLRIDGIAVTNGSYTRVLVANLTGKTQKFSIKTSARRGRHRTLSKATAQYAMADPEQYRSQNDRHYFEFGSHAIRRIDLTYRDTHGGQSLVPWDQVNHSW